MYLLIFIYVFIDIYLEYINFSFIHVLLLMHVF
jgi:hypothetical protein